MNKLIAGLLSTSLVVLGSTQFACDQQPAAEQNPQASPASSAADSTGQSAGSAKLIGPDRAEQIAMEQVPGSYVIGGEMDEEDGWPVYSVELKSEKGVYEVTIDANSGVVIELDDETADFQMKGKQVPGSVNKEQRMAAENAALDSIPGEVVEWKVRTDSTGTYYKFDVLTESGQIHKLRVAAGTNEILSTKVKSNK